MGKLASIIGASLAVIVSLAGEWGRSAKTATFIGSGKKFHGYQNYEIQALLKAIISSIILLQ